MQVHRLARQLQRAAEPGEQAPKAKTEVKSRRWLTPSAPTISRSCVAARTSVPQRVRWNSSQSSAEHDRPDRDQEQLVDREAVAEEDDEAARSPARAGRACPRRPRSPARCPAPSARRRRSRAAGTAPAPGRCGAGSGPRSATPMSPTQQGREHHAAPEAEARRPGRTASPASRRDRRRACRASHARNSRCA